MNRSFLFLLFINLTIEYPIDVPIYLTYPDVILNSNNDLEATFKVLNGTKSEQVNLTLIFLKFKQNLGSNTR